MRLVNLQELPAVLPAGVERRDRVDHRPAEPGQEAQASGEVRDGEVDHPRVLPRFPGDDRLDREFRQRLTELLARQRREAEAQAKKPPAREKPKKAGKTRSA